MRRSGGAGVFGRLPRTSRGNPNVNSSIRRFVVSFIEDEQGQDLVEYAMLGGFVALATMAGLSAIQDSIAAGYLQWDTVEQDLWIPPEPVGS